MSVMKSKIIIMGLLTVMAGILTTFIILYGAPVVLDPDQCSFFATSKFIANDGIFHYRDMFNLEYRDAFWAINNDTERMIYSVHSPGLALLLAGVQIIFGSGAEHYFIPLCAGLSIFLIYALARFFLPRIYALGAAFVLFTCPILFLNALLKNSHAVSLMFTLAALWLVFFANQSPRLELWLRSLAMTLAGILMGYSAVLRYPDILLLLVPLAYLFTTQKYRWRYRWISAITFAGGAAISLGFLAWYNQLAYGSIFKTGYSLMNAQAGGFSLWYFLKNVWLYLPGLVNHGFGLVFILFLLPLLQFPRAHKYTVWFWLIWIVPLLTLYHFYFWASPDTFFQTLRFYINILPALIILGLLALRSLWRRPTVGRGRWWLIGGAIVIQLLWSIYFTTATAEMYYATYKRTETQLNFVKANVPDGSFLFFTPDGQNFRPNISNLLAEHRWHIFAHDIFLLPQVSAAAKQNLEASAGKAATFQEQRVKNLANADVSLLYDLLLKFQQAEKAGKKFFYFGEVERLQEFAKFAAPYFEFGTTIVAPQPFNQYLLFSMGGLRLHHIEKPRTVYAWPLTITPLTLKPFTITVTPAPNATPTLNEPSIILPAATPDDGQLPPLEAVTLPSTENE